MKPEDIVDALRTQNWKNGGVLALDRAEAIRLVAEALQDRFDLGYRAAGGTILPISEIKP